MSAYRKRLLQTDPNHLIGYWPLSETFGAIVRDRSANDHAGLASEVAWHAPGIGDDDPAASFDPDQSAYINLHSTDLANAFDGEEGTWAFWLKAGPGAWTTTVRVLAIIQADSNNFIRVRDDSAANQIRFDYKAGGTGEAHTESISSTAWKHVVITWSKAAGQVNYFIDGSLLGTDTGLGTWSGTPTVMLLGAATTTPTALWDGSLAHAALWDKALSADQIGVLALQSSAPTLWTVEIDWDRDGHFGDPPSGNRLFNNDFALEEKHWSFDGGLVHSVSGGKLHVYRNGGSSASFYQDIAYATSPGDEFVLAFKVANTSASAKQITVSVHSTEDRTGELIQVYSIGAGAGETTKMFSGIVSAAWDVTRIEFFVDSDDNQADLTFDDISVSLNHAKDDITDRVISARWFLGSRTPYGDAADDSMLTLVLNNSDKYFSPEHRNSSWAGKLAPFKPIRIQSNNGLNTYTHWVGWIESIQPSVNRNGERTLEITAAGPMQFLKAAETRIALQENQRTDQIVDVLLQEVVIPPTLDRAWVLGRTGNSELGSTTFLTVTSAYAVLDEGAKTLAIAGDNWVKQGGESNQSKDTFDVYRAITDVAAAERGRFAFARNGKALYWNRHHLMVTPPNRLINGDFVLGETGWTFVGGAAIQHAVSSGKLQVYRNGGSEASFYQDFAYAMRPGDTFSVTFDVANTSSGQKVFDVIVKDKDDDTDLVSQRFTIAAGAGETTQTFNGTATGHWDETQLKFSLVTDDNDADLTFDNIAVRLHTFDNTMTGLSYQYAGLEQFKNEVVVVCHPRTLSDSDDEVLWTLEERVEVRGGENHTFEVKYRDDAGNRIGGKDVRVENARFLRLEFLKMFERKTDNDLVELDAGANSASLTIRNKGGYKPAVLVQCELQGRKITDFGQMEAVEVDAVSIRDYGRRTLRLNLPSVDSYEDARQIAQYELSRRSQPNGMIGSMSLKTHGTLPTRHHTMQLGLTLGDKVFVDEDQTVHQGDYCIIGEEHKLSNSATLLETTWFLEPAPTTYPWMLGVDGRSELSATTQLVY